METEDNLLDVAFAIVGGGIAAVSCAEQLAHELPSESILLISPSYLIKQVTNIKKSANVLEEFDVEQRPGIDLQKQYPNISIVNGYVDSLNSSEHILSLSSKQKVRYKKLCICAGAAPKVIPHSSANILGIRDTETIEAFRLRLAGATRIVVVGNGGIAIELVYGIENCKVIWAIKDNSIGKTFFDPGAAEFFLPHLKNEEKTNNDPILKRAKYFQQRSQDTAESCLGSALGPDWSSDINLKGRGGEFRNVHIEYNCEVKSIFTHDEYMKGQDLDSESSKETSKWPVYVKLSNGACYGCDFIVSATGVEPNIQPFIQNKFDIGIDGGLKVNNKMETSLTDVYAAGDICTASWNLSKHWFQMRLWTQARLMGAYAAKCMSASIVGENPTMDISFDLFAHVTQFFGYKVVLLGLFNCQKLGDDCELLLRMTKGLEYVKVVLQNGRMQGAVLIGETDLEETFENLILNQLDLSRYGVDLLNPDVDIEDYFD